MNLVPCYYGGRHVVSAAVDDSDYERVAAHRWTVSPVSRRSTELGAALARIDGETIAMSRFILGIDKGDPRVVHHRNQIKRDNRRVNLQICADAYEHGIQPHPKRRVA